MDQYNNAVKFKKLRKRFPIFIYESFSIKYQPDGMALEFVFKVDDYIFRPHLFLTISKARQGNIDGQTARSMAFHIGLVEMISYWKAFCCPHIMIMPYRLNLEQQAWWKDLFINGLGEFFYTNGISPDHERLFSFSFSDSAEDLPPVCSKEVPGEALAIPVGGGKDSVVTLEILKNTNPGNRAMVVNQRAATKRVIEAAGFDGSTTIEIIREIDPLLLKLNEEGFLNGHTPFSALLAFIALLASYLNNTGSIVLSNESSANEPSIPGTTINHQYSKSLRFEQDFRHYIQEYIHNNINYFSFLRPLNELQIAALFSGMNRYHHIFRSCNAGSKTDSWCCKCPKCLFTYIILAPFISGETLKQIFGSNLFDDQTLAPLLDQLCGAAENKPLECVGTIEEVNIALMSLIHAPKKDKKLLPVLLQHYAQSTTHKDYQALSFAGRLTQIPDTGNVPKKLLSLLEASVKDLSKLQKSINPVG